jgi:hypothetical protein
MIQSIFIAVNIFMAFIEAKLIEANVKIKHGWWAAGYAAIIIIIVFLTKDWWWVGEGILIRAIIFDAFLNVFRGLPVSYTSSTTTSVIDDLERGVFNNNWKAQKIAYVALYAVVLFLHLLL